MAEFHRGVLSGRYCPPHILEGAFAGAGPLGGEGHTLRDPALAAVLSPPRRARSSQAYSAGQADRTVAGRHERTPRLDVQQPRVGA